MRMKEFQEIILTPEEYVFYLNKLDLLYIDDDCIIDDLLLKWDHFYSLIRVKPGTQTTCFAQV